MVSVTAPEKEKTPIRPKGFTIHYDEDHDIAYFRVGGTGIGSSKVLSDTVWVDYDPDGNLIGVQVFDAKESSPFGKLLKQVEHEIHVFKA